MGLIDDIIDFFTGLGKEASDGFSRWTAVRDVSLSDEQEQRVLESDNPGQTYNQVKKEEEAPQPQQISTDIIEQFVGGFFDTVEDDVLENIEDGPPLTPENIEGRINDAEGAALEDALALLGSILAIEAAELGQLETHEDMLVQIATFLTLEDVLGRRLGMAYEKGVDPALEAEIAKNTRSEFVALPDAVEALLRAKTADEGWLRGENVDPRWADAVGSSDPVNPDNLVEEWGIRDDNLEILERVSLNAPEFEEILETPLQLGVPPTEESIDDAIQLSGLPDSIAAVFREAAENAPRSADMWEQRTTAGDLVTEIDTLVRDGELTVQQAEALLPDEVEVALPALRERWQLFTELVPGRPSQTDFGSAFGRGYIDRAGLEERLADSEFDVEAHPGVVDALILDELDGDLQESLALGLVDENTFSNLAQEVGLDQAATDALMAGESFGDITKRRLQEGADPAERSVTAIQGIGEARATSLETIGVETLADLAQASVDAVAEAADVSLATAERWITLAQGATS